MVTTRKLEQAYLVGLTHSLQKKWDAEESFEELHSLTDTAGAVIVGRTMVVVREIQPATFMGKGNVERIAEEIQDLGATLAVVDADLLPSQNRNLEEAWNVPVIDRTGIILDIFALHAKSKEGKLQVELAQYEYLYPRLVGAWSHFSKQRGGGVGLRGPGETQLEVDRRRVKERMAHLKQNLKHVATSRELHRKQRSSAPIPMATLVGYTNAGKSTLFNTMAKADELVQDKLFATLDPKTNKLRLPSGHQVLLSDTVGFIRHLPHQLVDAFKSTFEEAAESDLLIHVVDGADNHYRQHIEVVDRVLQEIGLERIPVLQVINKKDDPRFCFSGRDHNVFCVSAKTGEGLAALLAEVDRQLTPVSSPRKIFLPHPYGKQLAELYRTGRVMQCTEQADGVLLLVALPEKWDNIYKVYTV